MLMGKKTGTTNSKTGKTMRLLVAAMLLCAACVAATGCGDALSTTERARGEAQQETSAAAATATSAATSAAADAIPVPASDQVAVVFDTVNAAAYNDKFPETLGAFLVAFEPGDTAYSALEKTGVDFETRGRNYITSIGGIAEKVCGANSGWLYLVDGVQPTRNADEYELSGGETVLWAYTVKEGDVKGSVAMPDQLDQPDQPDASAEGKAA